MKYTFSQAKQKLAPFADAYGSLDLDDALNTAMEELSKSVLANDHTNLVTFTTFNQYFSLPQEYEQIIRAAVNNTPVQIRRTDYEFLSSGPGNLSEVPAGYAPLYGIQVLGRNFPTMYAPDRGMKLVAFATESPSGHLTVRGKDANGDPISAQVPVTVWTGPADIDTQDAGTVTTTTEDFYDITSVVLPQDASVHVSLYGVAEGDFYFLSRMHPSIRTPEFTRYRMAGFSDTDGYSYEILAEVKWRFMPLVDDDDIVPFDSLLPVQYMMKSFQYLSSNEIDAGMKYHMLAVESVRRREAQTEETQGIVIENALYSVSPGYQSNELYNNI